MFLFVKKWKLHHTKIPWSYWNSSKKMCDWIKFTYIVPVLNYTLKWDFVTYYCNSLVGIEQPSLFRVMTGIFQLYINLYCLVILLLQISQNEFFWRMIDERSCMPPFSPQRGKTHPPSCFLWVRQTVDWSQIANLFS